MPTLHPEAAPQALSGARAAAQDVPGLLCWRHMRSLPAQPSRYPHGSPACTGPPLRRPSSARPRGQVPRDGRSSSWISVGGRGAPGRGLVVDLVALTVGRNDRFQPKRFRGAVPGGGSAPERSTALSQPVRSGAAAAPARGRLSPSRGRSRPGASSCSRWDTQLKPAEFTVRNSPCRPEDKGRRRLRAVLLSPAQASSGRIASKAFKNSTGNRNL